MLEGVAFYAAPAAGPGTVRVYRLLKGSSHYYAVGDAARGAAVAAGWRYEHVAFHVRPASGSSGTGSTGTGSSGTGSTGTGSSGSADAPGQLSGQD
ncbi:hypothetical protein [Planomonospora algeriensis]